MKVVKTSKQYSNYKNSLTAIKCFKCPLSSIIRKQKDIHIIDDAVKRMNQIVIHTYRFLKLYCINKYHTTNDLPNINRDLIIGIMKTIASSNRKANFQSKSKKIMDELNNFNKNVYSKISGKLNLSYANLSQMIYDQSTQIMTALKNHIQEHFADQVRGYINIISNKSELINKYDKKYILKQLQIVKNDILKGTNKADNTFGVYVKHFNKVIIQDFKIVKSLELMATSNKNIYLLLLMVRMSINAERISRNRLSVDDQDKNIKILNCFPIRSSIIPSYVDIDGQLICRLLLSGNVRYYESNITKLNDELWNKFFKTELSMFRKKRYNFNHRISTDGVGCSIHFLRSDLYKLNKKDRPRQQKKPKHFKMDKYINDITKDERYEIFKTMIRNGSINDNSLVGIDPGKRDLIFCTNGDTKIIKKNNKEYHKTTTFTYTNGRRKAETKSEIFNRKLERDKKNRKLYGKTIKEIEQTLSDLNSNSCIWENMIKYMKQKNKVDKKLQKYYENKIHRIRKWYVRLNKMRSEANMLNRFERTFGSPKNTVILIGNWSENRPMRYQEPTMGKSIRRLFRNRGYKLYLVDECNTSKYLYESGEELVKFRTGKDGKIVHRVLTTALIKGLSERSYRSTSHPHPFIKDLIENANYRAPIINRDLNGSLNIRLKGLRHIYDLPEPEYMKRSTKIVRNKMKKERVKIRIDDIESPKIKKKIRSQQKAKVIKRSNGKRVKIKRNAKKVEIRNKRGSI